MLEFLKDITMIFMVLYIASVGLSFIFKKQIEEEAETYSNLLSGDVLLIILTYTPIFNTINVVLILYIYFLEQIAILKVRWKLRRLNNKEIRAKLLKELNNINKKSK